MAKWEPVAETPQNTYYIDYDAIREDGNIRKLWSIRDYKQRSQSGAMSSRLREEFNCKEEKQKLLSLTTFSESMARGDVVLDVPNTGNDWENILPGSAAEVILDAICAKP